MRGHRSALRFSVTCLVAALAAPAGPLAAHEQVTTRYTFRRDVLPIVEKRCAGCHRPGGIGAMSLLSYAGARPWAAAIRSQVLEGRMPPWPVEEGLELAGANVLTAREIDVIADWTSGGAPEGGAPGGAGPGQEDAPPGIAAAASTPGGGPAREPDLVLKLPPRALAASESEAREEAVIPLGAAAGRWLAAWEIRPGAPALLHDVLVWVETPSGSAALLGASTPGSPRAAYPPGSGRLLPDDARLRLSIHWKRPHQARGKLLEDRSEAALWLLEGPPERRVEPIRLEGPALVLDRPAALVSATPLPGAKGDAAGPFSLEAATPGGGRLLLFRTRGLRADWPVSLRPLVPPELPAGARLEAVGSSGELPRRIPVWIEAAR